MLSVDPTSGEHLREIWLQANWLMWSHKHPIMANRRHPKGSRRHEYPINLVYGGNLQD